MATKTAAELEVGDELCYLDPSDDTEHWSTITGINTVTVDGPLGAPTDMLVPQMENGMDTRLMPDDVVTFNPPD